MLKDLFNKKEEDTKDLEKKVLICIVIIVIGIMLSFIGTGNKTNNDKKKTEEITVKKEDIVSKLDLLKDNYNIYVYKNNGKEDKKVEISTYKDITIYTGNALNMEGYVQYKDKYYVVGKDEFTLTKKDKIKNEVPEYSYNFLLLKNITNYCTFIDNYNCNINVSNYLDEYNKLYNTDYKIDEDKTMTIKYKYDKKMVTRIDYDYSEINKIINKKDEVIKYTIIINSINSNDYSDQIKYFSEKKN